MMDLFEKFLNNSNKIKLRTLFAKFVDFTISFVCIENYFNVFYRKIKVCFYDIDADSPKLKSLFILEINKKINIINYQKKKIFSFFIVSFHLLDKFFDVNSIMYQLIKL